MEPQGHYHASMDVLWTGDRGETCFAREGGEVDVAVLESRDGDEETCVFDVGGEGWWERT